MVARGTRPGARDAGAGSLALGYYRISGSERQKDGYSLDSQQATVRAYVIAQGWVLDAEFSDVLSGKRDDRPGYQACLDRARELRGQGRSVVIVTKWLHRFGRNMLERVRSYQELAAIGCSLHGTNDGGYVPEFLANILASLAQEESRQIGERVSEMASYLHGQGWTTGRPANWGYLWRDPTPEEKALGAPGRVLAENPDEAPYVRELWQRAAAGESMRSLARWAQALPIVARGGRELAWASIKQVLRSPVYIGRVGSNLDVKAGADPLALPVGHWPALATDDQWRAVRAGVAAHKAVPRQASQRFLLTGFAYCAECGGRLSGLGYHQRHRLRDGRLRETTSYVVRYVCQGVNGGASGAHGSLTCRKSYHGTSLDADVLRQVGGALDGLLAMSPAVEAQLRAWWRRRQTAGSGERRRVEAQRETFRAAIAEQEGELSKATRMYVADKIDQRSYDAMKRDVYAQIEHIERQINELPATFQDDVELPDLDVVLSSLGSWKRALEAASVGHRRMALQLLIERVTPVRVGLGDYAGQIEWTPLGSLLVAAARQATGE